MSLSELSMEKTTVIGKLGATGLKTYYNTYMIKECSAIEMFWFLKYENHYFTEWYFFKEDNKKANSSNNYNCRNIII